MVSTSGSVQSKSAKSQLEELNASPSIDARYAFIKPPSFEALEGRLGCREREGHSEEARMGQSRT
ncbi:hypothetical protein N7449_009628 [Penicillium cf. viridicatum]|uniref:Uncharacterized protein n=1 Tax=Penicillium cf. viridicatum TaxID=2972119 RepID=A0A9W9JFP7_9EURO|nr:hypothetical protein N7449_009628 [Penicillium cf. viridicatum]